MVKYIKIGRLAIAYDNAGRKSQREAEAAASPQPAPPPPPAPPPKSTSSEPHTSRSGWVTAAKVAVILLVGLFVLDLILAGSEPADTAAFDAPITDEAPQQASFAQIACERADVQELVSKEARSILLQGSLSRLLALTMFGLVDPDEYLDAFERLGASFSGVQGEEMSDGSIACFGSMRIDGSNATAGQDIVQLPSLAWNITFADDGTDPNSRDFTIQVDPVSIGEGMLINGKPPEDLYGDRTRLPIELDEVSDAQSNPDAEGAAAEAATADAEAGAITAAQVAEEAATASNY